MVRVSNIKPLCTKMAFQCAACGEIQSFPLPDGKYNLPTKVIHPLIDCILLCLPRRHISLQKMYHAFEQSCRRANGHAHRAQNHKPSSCFLIAWVEGRKSPHLGNSPSASLCSCHYKMGLVEGGAHLSYGLALTFHTHYGHSELIVYSWLLTATVERDLLVYRTLSI